MRCMTCNKETLGWDDKVEGPVCEQCMTVVRDVGHEWYLRDNNQWPFKDDEPTIMDAIRRTDDE